MRRDLTGEGDGFIGCAYASLMEGKNGITGTLVNLKNAAGRHDIR